MYHRWILAGGFAALIMMGGGKAIAGDLKSTQSSTSMGQSTQAPWYERFTFGSELRDGANAWVPRGELKAAVKVDPRSRWGVTFGMQQDLGSSFLSRSGQNAGRTSAGAFYQISPKFRVGGEVVVPNEQLGVSQNRPQSQRREPGVKVESAFKF
ncbi:NtrZ family periplasmic regulatory protein [Candidatus Phycosocius spiralis]|uniref:Secreted protein n=1 Tax=Candidatus Phycosocius spiralis TaxID=2815099 RepID=A0ABQ4PTQ8_9PROT|nr:hypothetical protein [Candidatus Phycosocius spiralis]GIU66373.1 hypothetical protein PsB1_0527 [Candidatus Phycosocius spiralis]